MQLKGTDRSEGQFSRPAHSPSTLENMQVIPRLFTKSTQHYTHYASKLAEGSERQLPTRCTAFTAAFRVRHVSHGMCTPQNASLIHSACTATTVVAQNPETSTCASYPSMTAHIFVCRGPNLRGLTRPRSAAKLGSLVLSSSAIQSEALFKGPPSPAYLMVCQYAMNQRPENLSVCPFRCVWCCSTMHR